MPNIGGGMADDDDDDDNDDLEAELRQLQGIGGRGKAGKGLINYANVKETDDEKRFLGNPAVNLQAFHNDVNKLLRDIDQPIRDDDPLSDVDEDDLLVCQNSCLLSIIISLRCFAPFVGRAE